MSKEAKFWTGTLIALAGLLIAYKQLTLSERSEPPPQPPLENVQRPATGTSADKAGPQVQNVIANGKDSVAVGTVNGNVAIH